MGKAVVPHIPEQKSTLQKAHVQVTDDVFTALAILQDRYQTKSKSDGLALFLREFDADLMDTVDELIAKRKADRRGLGRPPKQGDGAK